MSDENPKKKIKKEFKEEPEAAGTYKYQNSGNAGRPFSQPSDEVERLENEFLPYCLQLIEPDASIDMLWEQPDEFMRKLHKLFDLCEHFRPKYPQIYEIIKDPLFQVRVSEKMRGVRNFFATDTNHEMAGKETGVKTEPGKEGKETGVKTEPGKEGKETGVKTDPWKEMEIKIEPWMEAGVVIKLKTEKDIKTEPTEH